MRDCPISGELLLVAFHREAINRIISEISSPLPKEFFPFVLLAYRLKGDFICGYRGLP
jgi:hypothetical protein